jgi:hypothetical protein
MIHTIIVGNLIVVVVTLWFSYFESVKIKNDVLITIKEKRTRSLGFFIGEVFLAGLISIYYNIVGIAFVIMFHSVYWTTFDVSLNLFRGKKALYLPKPNENSAISDDTFDFKNGGWYQLIAKLTLIVSSLTYIIFKYVI